MDILLVGASAREHALAWKFAESRKTGTIYTTSPYAGVDTLADHWGGTVDAWCAAHPDGIVIGEQDRWRTPAEDAEIRLSLPCLYDGKTVLPLPAVQLGPEPGTACAPASLPETVREDLLSRVVLPRLQGQEARGVFCFGFSGDDAPQLVSIHEGFGGMEAMAVLPMLRGELMALLLACDTGRLDGLSFQTNGTVTAVLPYRTAVGAPLSGLSHIAMNTGFFIGAAEKREERLFALDPVPLYICGRASNPDAAKAAAEAAIAVLSESSPEIS